MARILNKEVREKVKFAAEQIANGNSKRIVVEKLVDKFATLKFNHLELYVEGFSFEYKNFKKETLIWNWNSKEVSGPWQVRKV